MRVAKFLQPQRITLAVLRDIDGVFEGVIDDVTVREVRNVHGGENNQPIRELRLTLMFRPDELSESGWLIELRDTVVKQLAGDISLESDDWVGRRIRITASLMPDSSGRSMKGFEVLD